MYCMSTGIQRNSTNVFSHLQTHHPEYPHVYEVRMDIIHQVFSHRYSSATTESVLSGEEVPTGTLLSRSRLVSGRLEGALLAKA